DPGTAGDGLRVVIGRNDEDLLRDEPAVGFAVERQPFVPRPKRARSLDETLELGAVSRHAPAPEPVDKRADQTVRVRIVGVESPPPEVDALPGPRREG